MSLDQTDPALRVMLWEARTVGAEFLTKFGALRPFGMFLTVDGDTDMTDEVSDDGSDSYDDIVERVRRQLDERATSGGMVGIALLSEVQTAQGDVGLAVQIQTNSTSGLYIQRAVVQGEKLVLEEAEQASSLMVTGGLCAASLDPVPEDSKHPLRRRAIALSEE